jgi:hypothetical protein
VGYWPVIFGEAANLERIFEVFETADGEDPAETLRLAKGTDVQEFFARQAEQLGGTRGFRDCGKKRTGKSACATVKAKFKSPTLKTREWRTRLAGLLPGPKLAG